MVPNFCRVLKQPSRKSFDSRTHFTYNAQLKPDDHKDDNELVRKLMKR